MKTPEDLRKHGLDVLLMGYMYYCGMRHSDTSPNSWDWFLSIIVLCVAGYVWSFICCFIEDIWNWNDKNKEGKP